MAAFCDLGAEALHAGSREVLAAALASGQLNLLALVSLMDAQLTSADNLLRSRSVLLLSEARHACLAAARLSRTRQLLSAAALSPQQRTQLAFFFASKLADWRVSLVVVCRR